MKCSNVNVFTKSKVELKQKLCFCYFCYNITTKKQKNKMKLYLN